MKRSLLISTLFALTFLLAEAASAASSTVEFDVGEGARVRVRNFAGDVNIVSGAPDKIRVSYTTDDDRIEVVITQRINFIRVRTDFESAGVAENAPVYFEIQVPPGTRVVVNNTAGDISSKGEIKRVEFTTVSGDIRLEDATGEIALKTVNGNISLINVREAELKAGTVSGNIDIASSSFSGETYELETISGDINFTQGENASYFLNASTTIGSIENRLGNIENTVLPGVDNQPSTNGFYRNANSLISEKTTVYGGYNGDAFSASVNLQTISGNIVLEKE